MKKLVSRKLLIFKHYHVDFNKIKSFFLLWGKHENHIPTIEYLTHQILTIMRSKIETQRIFVLVNILTNWSRCHLQSNNLQKLWIKFHQNDSKVCYKALFNNLIKLIEKYVALKGVRKIWRLDLNKMKLWTNSTNSQQKWELPNIGPGSATSSSCTP